MGKGLPDFCIRPLPLFQPAEKIRHYWKSMSKIPEPPLNPLSSEETVIARQSLHSDPELGLPAILTRAKERWLLLLLATIQFTHVMDFMIMMPMQPQLARAFAITTGQFSFLVSSYNFAAAIVGFLAAFYIDRFDRKKALIVLYGGFTLATLFCALSPTWGILLAARIVTGAFGGILTSMILSVIGDVIPLHRRGAATGAVMSAFAISSILGVPVGLYLSLKFSWHAPFILLAALGAIFWVAAAYVLPSMRGHLASRVQQSPLQVLKNVVGVPNQRNAIVVMFTLMITAFTVFPFITPYLVNNVGIAEEDVPYIYLVGGIVGFFSSFVTGRIADRFGLHRTFNIFAALSIIPLITLTHMGPSTLAFVLTVFGFWFLFNSSRMVPATTIITSSVLPRNRGSFMSLNASMQNFGSSMGALIGGAIIVQLGPHAPLQHYDIVGYIASAGIVLCIFLLSRVKTVS